MRNILFSELIDHSWTDLCSTYSLLLVTYHGAVPAELLRSLISNSDLEITRLESTSWDVMQQRLSMTFLGQPQMFVCYPEADGLQAAAFDKLLRYEGPNTIIVVASRDWLTARASHGALSNARAVLIELPERILVKDFITLISIMNIPITDRLVRGVTDIFARLGDGIPFNAAELLARYVPLVTDFSQFSTEWLPCLIQEESSLFSLSAALFQKDIRGFFFLWEYQYPRFDQTFWFLFWNDQFFRAALYCSAMRAKQIQDIKTITTKLPFTFINRDWKKSSANQLFALCSQLYEADYSAKNGGSAFPWDLFFITYMQQ